MYVHREDKEDQNMTWTQQILVGIITKDRKMIGSSIAVGGSST